MIRLTSNLPSTTPDIEADALAAKAILEKEAKAATTKAKVATKAATTKAKVKAKGATKGKVKAKGATKGKVKAKGATKGKAKVKAKVSRGGGKALPDFANTDKLRVLKPKEIPARRNCFKTGQTVAQNLAAQKKAGFKGRRKFIRKQIAAGRVKLS